MIPCSLSVALKHANLPFFSPPVFFNFISYSTSNLYLFGYQGQASMSEDDLLILTQSWPRNL